MRQLYVILAAVCLLAFTGRAQEVVIVTNAPKTDLEAFEAQTDKVIVKGESLMNTINMGGGSIAVRCKESIDVGTGRKQYGMMLEFTGNDGPRQRALVDYSEMDGLLNGIDYLNKVSSDVTPLASFDAEFATKSNFRVVAHSSRRQGNVQVLVEFDDGARIPLSSDQVAQFRDLVSTTKNTLDVMVAGK